MARSAIRVFDLSIDGADNGLRIKSNASRGGLVHDVEYRDVCIRNTKNVIEMDTHYTASRARRPGNLIPEFRDIRLKGVRVLDGGNVILDGYDAARLLRMAWDNVVFDKPDAIKVKASHRRHRARARSVESPDHRRERAAHRSDERRTRLECETEVRAVPGNAAALPVGGGDYAAIVDAKLRGTDGAIVERRADLSHARRGADRDFRPMASVARHRLHSRTAAIAKSSRSIGRTSRCSARSATAQC